MHVPSNVRPAGDRRPFVTGRSPPRDRLGRKHLREKDRRKPDPLVPAVPRPSLVMLTPFELTRVESSPVALRLARPFVLTSFRLLRRTFARVVPAPHFHVQADPSAFFFRVSDEGEAPPPVVKEALAVFRFWLSATKEDFGSHPFSARIGPVRRGGQRVKKSASLVSRTVVLSLLPLPQCRPPGTPRATLHRSPPEEGQPEVLRNL